MSFYENFSAICKEKKISKETVCVKCGLSKSIHSKWKTSSPKSEVVVKLSECLGVSIDYLLLNKKPTLPHEYNLIISIYDNLSPDNKKMALGLMQSIYETQTEIEARKKIKHHVIKHSLYKVSAGIGYELDDEEWENIEVIDTLETRKADFAVTVDGDSMLPKYKDGDIVLIKIQQDIDIGQIGIFIMEGKGYLKEKGEDRLISLNPDYPDIFPSEYGEIQCYGLVVGTAQLYDYI